MRLQFQYPELFLLAIPLIVAYRRWGAARGMTGLLRITLLALLLLALTGPRWNLGGEGIDVIVVADRSRSLPANADTSIRELIRDLEHNRKRGDRIGLVTFGSRAEIEHTLKHDSELGTYTREIIPDGSDLNDALSAALNLVEPTRPARILVMSDGEANGASPLSAARRAREAGVPIDFRVYERNRIGDVAVESLSLPDVVVPREPFQFAVWVYASKESSGEIRVIRDGSEIARQERKFVPGMNRVIFRDVLERGGLANYSAELYVGGMRIPNEAAATTNEGETGAGDGKEHEKSQNANLTSTGQSKSTGPSRSSDPVEENNRGAGVVRVEAPPRVLLLNSDGKRGNVANALEAARLPVDVAAAKTHSLTQDALDSYRAVIIENVPAADLGRMKMERLAQWIEDLGGGLLMTGGQRSFGVGGYFKSPLDEVLPVSMELRQEHRKNRVAIAIALDRSGSMMAPVKGGGKVKMDLADLGTAEAVRLLSAQDKVAVIAVDSTPHVIVPMRTIEDESTKESIATKALTIQSQGGGIFVYEALVAAGNELMKAGEYSTRHIILFSDACDSEEPGDYKTLLEKYTKAGITVSVIGLGTDHDVHAELLKDIAKLGGGNIMFSDDPEELPRLFTQDTMSIARNTFIKHDHELHGPGGIQGKLLPDGRLMGELGSGPFPPVLGYNLSYLKPEATGALISTDEYAAPWLAFWYRGLGRVAALSIEADGEFSGQFGSWEDYAGFLVTQTRWLLNSTSPEDLFVTMQRDGQDAIVNVELDPERGEKHREEAPRLIVVPPGDERTKPVTPDFLWTGPNSLQARFRLEQTGTYRTLVKSAGKGSRDFVRGPTVTLPYSPEFAPRIGQPEGREILSDIAKLSGGHERTDILSILSDPPRSAQTRSLLPLLFTLCLVVLVLEIAGRRLSIWASLALKLFRRKAAATIADSEFAEGTAPAPAAVPWWQSLIPAMQKRRVTAPAAAAVANASALTGEGAASSSAPVPQSSAPKPLTTADLFDQAKRRASTRVK